MLYMLRLTIKSNLSRPLSTASELAPDRIGTRTWDTMYTAKIDHVRGKKTGRLLQYDPTMDTTSILATGFAFANGVAVDKDESFIMIAETFQFQTLKYHLQGDKQNTVEIMANHFTGYPDGADCSYTTGLCYTPLPSSILPLMKLIAKLPNPINMALRNLLMILPRSMAPKVIPYGGIVEMDPGNNNANATSPHQIRLLQDPHGTDIGMLTGVTLWDEKLYLGSLHNEFIGVYDLS
jgi:Strictosidine synthase